MSACHPRYPRSYHWLASSVLCLSSICHATPASAPALQGISFEQRLGARLPLNTALLDEQQRPITLGKLFDGVPVVLTVGYFNCPNLCSVTRDDLFRALQRSSLRAGVDYTLVALSIDPAERATHAAADAKAAALERFPVAGAGAAWHFVTAGATQIQDLTRSIGFHYRFDAQARQFIHPAGAVIVSPRGGVAVYLLGVGFSADAVRAAVETAGHGRIAAPAPAVLLLCYHFDAATGRYTLSVLKLMRLCAAVTALAVGAWLAWQHAHPQTGSA